MTISVSVKKRMTLRGAFDATYAAAADVARTGTYSQGVLSVSALGDNRFAWSIAPQSAFGIDFTGSYVTEHVLLPGEIRWHTVEGNMRSTGSYCFERTATGVIVNASIGTELPIALPAMAKTAAELFVRHRLMGQIADLFSRIDAELMAATQAKPGCAPPNNTLETP